MRAERIGLSTGQDGSFEQILPVESPLHGIDPRKIVRAREILGALSDIEAIEVALDLLVLDDAHAFERRGLNGDDF